MWWKDADCSWQKPQEKAASCQHLGAVSSHQPPTLLSPSGLTSVRACRPWHFPYSHLEQSCSLVTLLLRWAHFFLAHAAPNVWRNLKGCLWKTGGSLWPSGPASKYVSVMPMQCWIRNSRKEKGKSYSTLLKQIMVILEGQKSYFKKLLVSFLYELFNCQGSQSNFSEAAALRFVETLNHQNQLYQI